MEYKDIIIKLEKQIDLLLTKYKDLFTNEEIQNIRRIKFEMLLCSSDFKNDIEVKSCEISLRYFFSKVWGSELTNILSFNNGDEFDFVMCQSEEKENHVISAKLVSNNNVNDLDLNYGLICNIDDNLIMSSEEDVKLDFYSPKSIIVHFRSLVEMFEDTFLMSEEYVMGLNFPSQIKESVNNLVLLNRNKTKFSGVVLFEPCTSFDFQQAIYLAEKYNLDIIKISKDLYKEKIFQKKLT